MFGLEIVPCTLLYLPFALYCPTVSGVPKTILGYTSCPGIIVNSIPLSLSEISWFGQ